MACGLGYAILGLIIAAVICHFLFYLVPGLLGMKTGLPLYIVGTSTYGVQGGFLMPGFLMGLLQFGWLAVNSFFAGILLCAPFGYGAGTVPHAVVAIIWTIVAAFLGLKGIQYVAKVASFLPLIPIVILIILAVSTVGGIGKFEPQPLIDASLKVAVDVRIPQGETLKIVPKESLNISGVIGLLCTYVVGFFATAGAAGCDFGMNNRNTKDVQLGGLVGIAGALSLPAGLSLLIVAGVHGLGKAADPAALQTTTLMSSIVGEEMAAVLCIYWRLPPSLPRVFPRSSRPIALKPLCPRSIHLSLAASALLRHYFGRDRLGRQCIRCVQFDRRFFRTCLRRNGGRLPACRAANGRDHGRALIRRAGFPGSWVLPSAHSTWWPAGSLPWQIIADRCLFRP